MYLNYTISKIFIFRNIVCSQKRLLTVGDISSKISSFLYSRVPMIRWLDVMKFCIQFENNVIHLWSIVSFQDKYADIPCWYFQFNIVRSINVYHMLLWKLLFWIFSFTWQRPCMENETLIHQFLVCCTRPYPRVDRRSILMVKSDRDATAKICYIPYFSWNTHLTAQHITAQHGTVRYSTHNQHPQANNQYYIRN